eukprot:1565098-Rhodomonas_salina.1
MAVQTGTHKQPPKCERNQTEASLLLVSRSSLPPSCPPSLTLFPERFRAARLFGSCEGSLFLILLGLALCVGAFNTADMEGMLEFLFSKILRRLRSLPNGAKAC